MARWDPIWTYGESKVIESDPYWSYGESKYYGEPEAKRYTGSNIAAMKMLLDI